MGTFSGTNWFLTCYLLFYPLHVFLNKVIKGLSQNELLRVMLALSILYIGFNFFKEGMFFSSILIVWVAIYFIVAYVKLYCEVFITNTKINIIVLLSGIIGHIGIIVLTNLLGLYFDILGGQMLRWNVAGNPFCIMVAISLFNLVKKITWKNEAINHISKLSLLIYIIHENIILRTYYRPYLINLIWERYGYQCILWYVFLLSVLIFLFALFSSLIYEKILQRLVLTCSDKLYKSVRNIYAKIEKHIITR